MVLCEFSVLMTNESECPVCDRRVPATAERCPNCGAYFTMASFEDLEQLARDIATGMPPMPRANEPTLSRPTGKVIEATPANSAPNSMETQDAMSMMASNPKADEAESESARPSDPEIKSEAEAEKAEDKEEGKKGIGRLFGRKKK